MWALDARLVNEHLRPDPKGNSVFCFPETLKGEVKGKQNPLFHSGPVIKCFAIPPSSKIENEHKLGIFLLNSSCLDSQ